MCANIPLRVVVDATLSLVVILVIYQIFVMHFTITCCAAAE